jgi:hypothetical protein
LEPIIVSIPGEISPKEQKEEALLASCKYYKGEEECPFVADQGEDQNKRMFWWYERKWIKINNSENGEQELEGFASFCDMMGLGEYARLKGLPLSLVGLFYNRYDHWLMGPPDDFKEWLSSYY